MDKPMPNLMFKGMSFIMKFRDLFRPREKIFNEVDIKPNFNILDFGCGPGSYCIIVSKCVGELGKVYALDIHPLAVKKVQDAASKMGLTNIETICSDCATHLPDESIDVILLYDIFHMLSSSNRVLEELHRVLKQNGTLSFSDHHMKENDIISKMTKNGLFCLSSKGKYTYSFMKK